MSESVDLADKSQVSSHGMRQLASSRDELFGDYDWSLYRSQQREAECTKDEASRKLFQETITIDANTMAIGRISYAETERREQRIQLALSLCRACSVLDACLENVLPRTQLYKWGVIAGLTSLERKELTETEDIEQRKTNFKVRGVRAENRRTNGSAA